jgi:cardiolipin synthase
MLYVEPSAGTAPVAQVIEHAQKTVDLNVYEITSKTIEAALKSACERGVKVRVMLDMEPYHASQIVPKEKRALGGSCIDLKGAPPRFTARYTYDHAKYVVADPQSAPAAEVGTANFTWSAFHRNREYLWQTHNPTTVHALAQVFDADWNRVAVGQGPRHSLVLSPHSTGILASLIGQQGTVHIEGEEMGSDKTILSAIEAKGSHAQVLLPSSLSRRDRRNAQALEKSGVQVRTLHKPFMHAKMIVGDTYGFIGSENFSSASLERNREAGVAFTSKTTRAKLEQQFQTDWQAGRPL